jgi:fatty acid desaturase
VFETSDNLIKNALTKDVREMNEFLRKQNKANQIRELGKSSLTQTLFAIAQDWAWIFIATSLVYFGSLWLPVAMIVIGSRQRALVVLTHDASHYLLAKNHYINDVIANVFLCFPMVKSLKHYRAIHMPHHMNLGDEEHDTDYLNDPEGMKKGWLHVYLKHLLSYDLWTVAELTQTFRNISKRHVLCLALWWGTVLAVLSLSVGAGYAAAFFALWFFSRAIMYHVITTFIIISDHHGLLPGTILGYTRNHPSAGILRWFIHPHNNGFHLAHHLTPYVPFYNLNKARKLLNGWDKYDAAEQCETYFVGKKSVVHSWGKSTALEADRNEVPFYLRNAKPAFEALEAVMKESTNAKAEKRINKKLHHRAA